MKAFKYQLEPYKGMKTRYTCPNCGSKKQFVRYIDVETGQHIGEEFGRCNREVDCAYHMKPSGNLGGTLVNLDYEKPNPTFLKDDDIIKSTYYSDNLFKFLKSIYGVDKVRYVYDAYKVRSTNKPWYNSTVFYQIDSSGRYRTGKVISYDVKTGKRIKKPFSRINWVHRLRHGDDFVLQQCLFGEHLLASAVGDPDVYLVESEKTALICMLNDMNGIYIATGGLSNINREKMAVLSEYDVVAIPDKGGYEKWSVKLKDFATKVMNLDSHPYLEEGEDVADLILKRTE